MCICRGLRHFGPNNNKKIVLILIHNLGSWTEGRLWEFLSKKKYQIETKLFMESLKKKHYINKEKTNSS